MDLRLKGLPQEFYQKALEILLENIDWGVQITDKEGYTIYYNKASSQIDGIPIDEAIGKHVLAMFPSLSNRESTILKVLRTGEPVVGHEQEITNCYGQKVSLFTITLPIVIDGEICGAIDISKNLSEIKNLMTKVIDLREEVRNKMHQTTKSNEEAYYTFDDIIGESKAIKELKYKAQKIARSNSPVFVYGETGTGKELLVQAIHNASPRKNGPFIAQNCAALPENLMESILFGTVKGSFTGAENRPGLVELADGGTLFLDEITSLSFDLQAKLLRFLQEGYIRRVGDSKIRKVNVRVISASNIPPQEALEKKILRPDLFYRLNSISLCVPPLRERKSDIPLLVKHFIEEFNRELRKNIKGISGEVERVLMSLSWPGNVRELKGVIEYAANFCEGEIIQLHDLPDYILKNAFIAGEKEITVKNTVEMKEKSIEDTIEEVGDLRAFLSRIEYELISKALKRTNGNVSRAAEILGIPRQTLQYKIKTLKITI
ncbi:MAG: NtrC family Transcriptional regulator, ATPase domain protein [Caldanaerobacter subterraneus]|uniref:Sigma-54-dependent Fis family transcriptional regulator n=1 Tax=Caldanaerobacter subterraneus TaxID=911092 RepID=A0A101E4Q8_9THEO|nr:MULTISPECIES: sigma 54-interacting transcriptional regulator [Caldanaerobacter]KUK08583.1 MAG: NtrC family Transcriptional regulator, ATPase domain protein [Caldanaerobacter subterraneus]MDI3517995.1 arginine utilization regulatory protein [Caldanaerobacter sp.]MDK2793998.1 arginine utilization regulatory protein [Caldanaerobacter sp.]HBT50396.1 sigma-54-dependent Fis family transcriptional regulator [Caldanaerobacter subterraneus]